MANFGHSGVSTRRKTVQKNVAMAHLGYSRLLNRGRTAQKKPAGEAQELVPSPRYAKALVRKAASLA
jgi:ABC-type Zn uptake system ZnuABC Zn-binding protein ZnuA